MDQEGSGDRRKKPRIPRRLPVRFGSESRMCGGTAIDISEGGLRVETPEAPFPANSVLQVFVQFPSHAVRLKARVAWIGGRDGGGPVLGLSFTRPEPQLAQAYKEWLAEVKLASRPSGEAGAGPALDSNAPADPPGAPGAPTAASPKPPESPRPQPASPAPKGPVKRRLETRQGNAYNILIDRQGGECTLTIVQVPRQIGVDAPDYQDSFPDYESAEKALRDFLRTH